MELQFTLWMFLYVSRHAKLTNIIVRTIVIHIYIPVAVYT